jgi:hypothetical protein
MLIASVWRFFNPVPVLFWFFDRLHKNITGGAKNFNTPALRTDPVKITFFLVVPASGSELEEFQMSKEQQRKEPGGSFLHENRSRFFEGFEIPGIGGSLILMLFKNIPRTDGSLKN